MATRPRVLIADDHPGVARMLVEMLSHDCEVVGVVADGGEVAGAAATHAPVLSLIDVNLPTRNGLEVCRDIVRADPAAKIILMSGMIADVIVEEAIAAGAAACIPKARAATELLPAIKRTWMRQ